MAIWLTTNKTQETRVKWPSMETCDMMLKISNQRLQLLKESQVWKIMRFIIWELQDFHFGFLNILSIWCSLSHQSKKIIGKWGGDFLSILTCMDVMSWRASLWSKVGSIFTKDLHYLICASDLFVRCPTWLSHHLSPISDLFHTFLFPM